MTRHAKETTRSIYRIDDPGHAEEFVGRLIDDRTDPSMPIEVRSLGRTMRRWRDQITAWHQARVSNGPTEAVTNLVKRVKRVSFGITNCQELSDQGVALRGQAQLGPTRHHHTPLNRGVPQKAEQGGNGCCSVAASGAPHR